MNEPNRTLYLCFLSYNYRLILKDNTKKVSANRDRGFPYSYDINSWVHLSYVQFLDKYGLFKNAQYD